MGPLKRKAVLDRDGWQCHYCGRALTKRTGTVDHKTPKALGGDNSMENLVGCCEPCNTRKADMPYEAFIALPVVVAPGPLQPVNSKRSTTLGKLPAGAVRPGETEQAMWSAITADRMKL